jgi:hypothetical protein
MIFISHRGNTTEKFESWENEPTYIDQAIKNGYDVEVDVWVKSECYGSQLYLGHDKPQYGVNLSWYEDRRNNLWIHCKNHQAVDYFSNTKFNWFWHDKDDMTLTSNGYIWVYPGKQPINNSVAVLPELHTDDVSKCVGICSDIIEEYRNAFIR